MAPLAGPPAPRLRRTGRTRRETEAAARVAALKQRA